MKTKEEFVEFLRKIKIEMEKSNADTNSTTSGFLDGLSSWLEDTNESGPTDFNWAFAAQFIRAGIFYE